MDAWNAVQAARLDLDLRKLLKGVRLVGELNLELTGETYLNAEKVIRPLLEQHKFAALRVHPAALCIFLVAQGRHHYRHGAFWDQLDLPIPLTADHQSVVGGAYHDALFQLGLEAFSDERREQGAQKYLFPILLHGGIPEDGADDVWKALVNDLRRGIFDVEEIQMRLGSRGIANNHLTKPARRFFTYGESYARDLLARMIDVSESISASDLSSMSVDGLTSTAVNSGVPEYLLRGFVSIGESRVPSAKRIARPQIAIDPYGGEGPILTLPLTPREMPPVIFRIHDGNSRLLRGSTLELTKEPLSVSGEWMIACEYGTVARTWQFSGVPKGRAFLFDEESGALLRNQQLVLGTQVLVLFEKDAQPIDPVSGDALPIIETCADLNGPWRTWHLQRVDLSNCSHFVVPIFGQSASDASLITVNPSRGIAEEISKPLQGVYGADWQNVFDHLPRFATSLSTETAQDHRLRWRDREQSWSDLSRCPVDDEGLIDLSEILSADGCFDGEILLRGPLGSDFRRRFVVVPGLSTTIPTNPVSPTEVIEVAVSLPSAIEGEAKILFAVNFQAYESRVQLDITKNLSIMVTIPRIAWSLRLGGETIAATANVPVIDFEELISGEAEALLVRTGVPAEVSLELRAGKKVLHRTQSLMTSRESGRWSFSLTQFIDDVNQSNASEVQVYLLTYRIAAEVVRIVSKYEVSNFHLRESVVPVDNVRSHFQFEWQENKKFANRVIRIWSLVRPWEPPLEFPLEPDADASMSLKIENEIVPGRCLAELTLSDEWRVVRRPSLNSTSTLNFSKGTSSQIEERLDRLNPTDFANGLELLLQGRHDPIVGVDLLDLKGSVAQLASAFEVCIGDYRGGVRTELRIFLQLLKVVQQDPEFLGLVLAEMQIRYPHRLGEYTLNLLPFLREIDQSSYSDAARGFIWSISEEVGATLDAVGAKTLSDQSAWVRYCGWPQDAFNYEFVEDAQTTTEWVANFPGHISRPISQVSLQQLREIIPHMAPIPVSLQKPLGYGGFFDAAIELFGVAEQDPRWITNFISEGRQFERFVELAADQTREFYGVLTPERMSEPLANVPQLLLAVALHVVRSGRDASRGVVLLIESQHYVPLFVKRSVLLACALTLMEGESPNVGQ